MLKLVGKNITVAQAAQSIAAAAGDKTDHVKRSALQALQQSGEELKAWLTRTTFSDDELAVWRRHGVEPDMQTLASQVRIVDNGKGYVLEVGADPYYKKMATLLEFGDMLGIPGRYYVSRAFVRAKNRTQGIRNTA